MDLTKLSDADLLALKGGDYSKMSDGGLQALKASSAPPPQESYGSDLVKSVGSGLEQGTATALGLPGDLASLAHAVAPQSVIDKVKAVPGAKWLYNHLPGSQAVLDSASDPMVDPNYQPQYAPNRYVQAVGKNLGPGLATGMGLPATLVGAVAGQGVEDITGSKTAGAVANVGASIATPLALARYGAKGLTALKTADELHSLGDAGYKTPLIRDTTISPQATEALAGNMQNELNASRSRFSPARAQKTTEDIARLAESNTPRPPASGVGPPAPPSPVSIEDLHNFRKDLRETAKEVGTNFKPTEEATAAIRAQRVLNQYLENIPSKDVVHGNPIDAVEALNTAGRNWGAYNSADRFGNIIENAQLRANGQGSGANFGNTMRQEAYKLLKDGGYKAKQLGAGPDAMALLNKLNTGDFATNALRRASNYMGGGGGIANHAAAALFGQAAGPAGYVLGATVGPALRMASNARTLGTAKRVQDLLLQRAPVNAAIASGNRITKAANSAAYSNAVGSNGIPAALLQAIMLNKYGRQ